MLDLERATLSQLTTPDAVQQCWNLGLRAEAFEDPQNARIYQFVIDYWMSNSMRLAPSAEVVATEFIGYATTDADESLTWLTGKLQDRLKSNRVQEMLRSAAALSTEDPGAALDELYVNSWTTKELTMARQNRVVLGDTIEARRDRYTDRQNASGQRGAPIGLTEVDEHTGGILPGEVAIVAAYTKTGKSFLLVNAAVAAARAAGYTPFVASLEQPIPEFEDRIDALYSGVGYGKLQRGVLSREELTRLHEAQEEMASNGPFHLERPERGERTVVNIVNRARQVGANYLIIDQLSWLETQGRYRERRDQYQELIYDLKEEVSRASAGEMPVFMAVQYNRQAVSTKGETGGLHNIANSADIEQTVDTAYGLHRNSEMRANNCMIMKTLGSRRGDIKSWMLGWHLDEESAIYVRREYDESEGEGGTE